MRFDLEKPNSPQLPHLPQQSKFPQILDGKHLGLPHQTFRVHSVEGSPNTFLLFEYFPQKSQVSLEKEKESPQASENQWIFDSFFEVTGHTRLQLKNEYRLEEDLGIDPLKKNKILHILSKKNPIPQNILIQLNACIWESDTTFGHWTQLLQSANRTDEKPIAPLDENQIIELLLQVTQEKTGYERELLNLDADLEGDLGIDTIKQAQIAGHVRKLFPGKFDFSLNSGFRIKDFPTLRHWVKWLSQENGRQENSKQLNQKITWIRSVSKYEVLSPLSEATHVFPLHYLIIESHPTIGSLLAQELLKKGAKSVQIHQKYSDINKHIIEAVIYLSALSTPEPASADNGEPIHELECLRIIQKSFYSLKAAVACVGIHNANERRVDGSLRGFFRTLGLEKPDLFTRLIEFDRSEIHENKKQSVLNIIKELQGSSFFESSYFQKQRNHYTLIESPLACISPPILKIDSNSIILFSGGLKGIGFEIAKDLARTFQPHLIILGRTHEANSEIQPSLTQLKTLGSACIYVCCDVTQSHEVEALVPIIQELYPSGKSLLGIIHGAGILEDRGIESKTEDSFLRVYQTKVLGLKHLSKIAINEKSQFFCAFSSISGRLGNGGQCDYASANSAMSSMMQGLQTEHPGIKSFTIAWGAWDEVGMAARTGISEILKDSGLGTLSPKAGSLAFRNELLWGGNNNETVIQAVGQPAKIPKPLVYAALEKYYFFDQILRYQEGNHLSALKSLSLEKENWLKDHQILGVPVLPATFGIEIMTQAALALFPDYWVLEIRNINIHKPVQLENHTSKTIQIEAQGTAGTCPQSREVYVQLFALDSSPYPSYEAVIILQDHPLVIERPVLVEEPVDLLSENAIYQSAPAGIPLGPAFHILSEFKWDGQALAFGKTEIHAPFSEQKFYSMPLVREAGFHAAALMRMKLSQEVLVPRSIHSIRYFGSPLFESQLSVKVLYKGKSSFDILMYDLSHALCTQITDFKAFDITQLTKEI